MNPSARRRRAIVFARLERALEVARLDFDAGDAAVVPHAALAEAELAQHSLGRGDGLQLLTA